MEACGWRARPTLAWRRWGVVTQTTAAVGVPSIDLKHTSADRHRSHRHVTMCGYCPMCGNRTCYVGFPHDLPRWTVDVTTLSVLVGSEIIRLEKDPGWRFDHQMTCNVYSYPRPPPYMFDMHRVGIMCNLPD